MIAAGRDFICGLLDTRCEMLDFFQDQGSSIQYPRAPVKTTQPLSYFSAKTKVRESKIHGRGLFATADIAKDEVVAVKGGHIVDRKTLREKITPRLGPVEIQIDDDLFIAPVTSEERELSMLYSNHSCNANLGIRGEITFVAMRDIHAGEELTHDWAVTDDDDYSVQCRCGAPNCRKQ
jgi:uncharacterized protein